jgi:hypothetical protein
MSSFMSSLFYDPYEDDEIMISVDTGLDRWRQNQEPLRPPSGGRGRSNPQFGRIDNRQLVAVRNPALFYASPSDPAAVARYIQNATASAVQTLSTEHISEGAIPEKDALIRRMAPINDPAQQRYKSLANPFKLPTALRVLSDHPLVIGIPTSFRQPPQRNHLLPTVHDLFDGIPEQLRPYVRIVVLNTHEYPEDHQDIPVLRSRFQQEINAGLLHIIEWKGAHSELKLFGDHSESSHVKRATAKDLLDTVYLMDVCASLGKFYMHLDDHISPARGYLEEMMWWLGENYMGREDWFMLSFHTSRWLMDRSENHPGYFRGIISAMESIAIILLVDYNRNDGSNLEND